MTAAGAVQRERICSLVAASPGLSMRTVAKLLGIGWTACEHHVSHLERQQRVLRRRVGSAWLLFDPNRVPAPACTAAGALADAVNRRVAQAVRAMPGAAQHTLAEHTGRTPSSVCRRLKRLDDAGIVRRVQSGTEVHVFPAPGMDVALAHIEGEVFA
jgi:predicted transcriptional regulator